MEKESNFGNKGTEMKKLIIFVVLSFVSVFAEDYTKDTWYCKVAKSCELSDYTGKYTKNCEDYSNVLVYWEYSSDKYENSLFCHKYGKKEKQCTKIISSDTDENNDGEKILIISGETIDYIFGESYDDKYTYLNIIYHTKNFRAMISHSLCVPLSSDLEL